ncbi:MAG: glycoside hydrolase family 172 protein, partial [Verrucomicrobiota bacterium]
LPFVGYFDRKHAPFTRPALVHTVARGWNNYTPIPYQKSCKVVADPGWGLYYHFTYSTFPEGTTVPTFKRELVPEEDAALDEANRLLSACGPPSDAGGSVNSKSASLEGDVATESVRCDGPAAITAIRVKVQLPPAPGNIEALRSVTLQLRWDGESEPSVWAPLGDFFGTAPGANPYRSLPLGLTEDGWWYCNWFMPFAKSAELTFKQEGRLPLKLEYQVATRPLQGDLSRFARFHAKWHRDALLPAEPERRIDWPILKTEGPGRFVGVMLHIWNPRGGWWGEGDEKFFVDGEKFPSTFGTGSEDYFGYAWCDPAVFQNAFHDQTRNDGNNKGHVSVNRWHITDSVPFQKSFEGCIEKYYPNQRPTLYAAVAYWYQAPGGKDPYPAAPLRERVGYWTGIQVYKVPGVLEGERLRVLAKTGGDAQEQDMTGFAGQWSNDAHLWWTGAKPGDKLDLALPIGKTGRFRVSLQLTRAPDYGIVQPYLDGQKLGEPIDLYHGSVVPTGALALGRRDLAAGQHKLTLEIVGANPKAIPSYMAGLDYIKLDPE